MRTFIAVDTPENIKRKMTEVQSELKLSDADVKWETSNKFHITIKFLGEVKETMIDDIIGKIQEVSSKFPPFALQYEKVGCFPNMKNPRVFWIGCRDISQNLSKIKTKLDEQLKQFGFEAEDRAFHPHITLGRVKSQSGIKNLIPIIENLTFKSEVIECQQILIMKSVLKPSGSEYSILQSVILK
jgi:RNA 2',3'-cyclic 3'-phosphodiesterase